jgi:two-component system, NarL family, sensor histidine kinase DesK
MRKATRLTRLRWLLVASVDVANLTVFLSVVQLAVMFTSGLLPAAAVYAGAAGLVVFYALTTRPFRILVRNGPRPTALLAVAGVIALVYAAFGLIWLVPAWIAMFAPFVRPATYLKLAIPLTAACYVYFGVLGGPVALAAIVPISIFVTGGLYANVRVWWIFVEAYDGQGAKAALAVSEERLRFARDLNDLLGQSLVDISSRTGQAAAVLAADPGRAEREMFEVRDLARRSLREVRTTVQDYRALDLGEVLASVRAVLEAADVQCEVDADLDGLAPEARTLLAAVVREGATNVLKHSAAQRCAITIRNGVLEMSNDGVSEAAGPPAGLRGLSQRVRAAGGTLTAGAEDGRHVLRAAL